MKGKGDGMSWDKMSFIFEVSFPTLGNEVVWGKIQLNIRKYNYIIKVQHR